MVPGVTAVIVRRRGQPAVRQAPLPVGLAFQIGTVAGAALLGVNPGAERDARGVARIGTRIVARRRRLAACDDNQQRRECEPLQRHSALMNSLISFGEAKMIEERSPCMPAPTATGLPGSGPSLLESLLNRRLNSQTFSLLPSAVSTV